MRKRGTALPAALLAAVLLAGCGGDDGPEASADAGPTTTPTSESSPTEDSTEPTVEPVPPDTSSDGESSGGASSGGASSGGGSSGDDGSTGGGSGSTGGGSPDGGTEGLPGWPIESTPFHGAHLWAAYVAVGAPGDPQLQQVLESVQQSWPGASIGAVGCDYGAAEALGLDPGMHAVAVYFETDQHITEFRRRWSEPYVGAARVRTYCAD